MSELLNYSGLVVGVIGIVVTVFVAVRYAERRRPRAYSLSRVVIGTPSDAPQPLQVLFHDRPVSRLTATAVWFWNDGARAIRRTDVPDSSPLALSLSDDSGPLGIVDMSVTRTSRDAIRFSAGLSSANTVRFSFDFLDANDGALIEILHTGTISADIRFSGIILGVSRPVLVRRLKYTWRQLPLALVGVHFLDPFSRSSPIVFRLFHAIALVFAGALASSTLSLRDAFLLITPDGARRSLTPLLPPSQLERVMQALFSGAFPFVLGNLPFFLLLSVLLLIAAISIHGLLRSPLPLPRTLLGPPFRTGSGSSTTSPAT